MNQEEVREVVRLTIDQLLAEDLIDKYKYINKVISKRLEEFFITKNDRELVHALNLLSDNPYIDIIYLQYRDGKTLEFIAEYFDVDVSTIKRNKKALIEKLYKMLMR